MQNYLQVIFIVTKCAMNLISVLAIYQVIHYIRLPFPVEDLKLDIEIYFKLSYKNKRLPLITFKHLLGFIIIFLL